jgi:propionyl-CoA carboxylase alpha chain
MPKKLRVRVGEKWHTVEVQDITTSPARVLVDGESVEVDLEGLEELVARARPRTPTRPVRPDQRVQTLSSPLPGLIVSVSVRAGDEVRVGDEVCVLEAMKMHQSLRSEWTGTVTAIYVIQGQHVGGRESIADIAVG